MDAEFDRAAQKHKLSQRQGALRAKQRQRQEEEERRSAHKTSAAPGASPSASESASGHGSASSSGPGAAPPAASHNPEFKQAVAQKFKELVATGVPPNEAAVKAITLVREALSASAGASSSAGAAATRGPPPAAPAAVAAAARPIPQDRPCPGPAFTCFVCLEHKSPEERFLPRCCSKIPEALCCRPCYAAWLESQIDAEAAVIRCCHCDLLLDPSILARLVDAEHFEKYCNLALQRTLRRDPSFIWCSKCSSGGWVDLKQPTSKCGWTCPECSNSFVYCSFCRREHGSLTCKAFQQIRREIFTGQKSTDRKASDMLVQRTSKTCPSCNMPIQKDGGCNFMDCPNCRRHFCWSCGRILKGSHQKHDCDAGFEGSAVVHKSPNGQRCVEFPRLFTNVLDIDGLELLNTDDADMGDFREMLVPGISQEQWSPLFVGPSECDGEIALRIPFNFQRSMSWELTHILVRAAHPPAPSCAPPKSIALLPNVTSVAFSDFDDASAIVLPLKDNGNGALLAHLEPFNTKGVFKRVTCLAMRFSVAPPPSADDEVEDDMADMQVFINDIALFGVPGDRAASIRRDRMWDERADLIVSPVLTRRRWGEEIDAADEETIPAADLAGDADAPADDGARAEWPERVDAAWGAPAAAANDAAPLGREVDDAHNAAQRARLMCANPTCGFLVHSRPELGGYCCIACSESDAAEHGPRCQRVVAPVGAQRAPAGWWPMAGENLAEQEFQDALATSAQEAGTDRR